MADMSFFDPAVQANPYPYYHQIRQYNPVFWDPHSQLWIISGYSEVSSLLRHRQCSSAYLDGQPPTPLRPLLSTMQERIASFLERWVVFSDPPEHAPLRSFLKKGFSPKMVERLKPFIQHAANKLFDDADPERLDFIKDLSHPLTQQVIGELLALPKQHSHKTSEWVEVMYDYFNDKTYSEESAIQGMNAVIEEANVLFTPLIEKRLTDGGDDFLALLVRAREEEKLEPGVLLSNCLLLMIAGQDTTVNFMGNALVSLLHNPDQLQLLRKNHSLLPCAMEELLRFDAPTQALRRTAKEDLQLGDQTILKGQQIFVLVGAANHDPKIFKQPAQLNLERDPNPHLSFGLGSHYCIGSQLARLEAAVVFDIILNKYSDIQLVEEPTRRPFDAIRGYDHIPVRLAS